MTLQIIRIYKSDRGRYQSSSLQKRLVVILSQASENEGKAMVDLKTLSLCCTFTRDWEICLEQIRYDAKLFPPKLELNPNQTMRF